jgi:Family of unknown function (DUF5662)
LTGDDVERESVTEVGDGSARVSKPDPPAPAELYDSAPDTLAHIEQVRELLEDVIGNLHYRASVHDASKLRDPEKAVFDEFSPKLATSTYGSDEYKQFLVGMGEGLNHHYANNDHHPEHWQHGIADMDLIQVIEMLADWKAATLRHENGSLSRSIAQNAERFGYGVEFYRLLWNTADRMGWLEPGAIPTPPA